MNHLSESRKKAAILAQALPWLERYHGKIIVIKYGGNAMIHDNLKKAFAENTALSRTASIKPVDGHPQAPQISIKARI